MNQQPISSSNTAEISLLAETESGHSKWIKID